MTKVVDLNITPGQEDLMKKGINVKDRKTQINIEKKDIIWRKRNLKVVSDRSIISQVVTLWEGLTSVQKTAWETAAAYSGMRGYDLFVQDTSYRIQNNLAGVATPNNFHQFKVMKVETDDPQDVLGGAQTHHDSQNVRQYRAGSKKAYDWNLIEEELTGSIKIEFNYYSDLVALPVYHFWEVICSFYGTKGGVDDDDILSYNLDLVTGWKAFSQTITPDLDTVDFYRIKIYGYRVSGLAYFDNFNFEHNSTNFAFDPNCNRVYQPDILRNNFLTENWYYSVLPDTMHPRSVYIS